MTGISIFAVVVYIFLSSVYLDILTEKADISAILLNSLKNGHKVK